VLSTTWYPIIQAASQIALHLPLCTSFLTLFSIEPIAAFVCTWSPHQELLSCRGPASPVIQVCGYLPQEVGSATKIFSQDAIAVSHCLLPPVDHFNLMGIKRATRPCHTTCHLPHLCCVDSAETNEIKASIFASSFVNQAISPRLLVSRLAAKLGR